MNFLFCPSYRPLFYALHLKDKGMEITVITYDVDVSKVCGDAGIKCLYFKLLRPSLINFFKMIILKRRLDNIIKEANFSKGDCFYLMGKEIAYEGFYLAKKFSKKGKIYYREVARELKVYKRRFNRDCFHMLGIKYLLKIFLGLDVILYETNNYARIGINDKFFKRYHVTEIDKDKTIDDVIVEVARKSRYYPKNYDNLIAADGQVTVDVVEYGSLRNAYKAIADLPLEFAIKHHPSPVRGQQEIFRMFGELFGHCDEIPGYIPIELVFNNIRKSVVSVWSAALIAASRMGHLKAISLLELVEWHNPRYKQEVKEYLQNGSHDRIVFIKDFEELRRLLLDTGND